MAKKNTDEYLASILNILDDIAKTGKKSSNNGTTNVPNMSGVVLNDTVGIKQLSDSLNMLASAIVPIAKISKDNIKNATDNIKLLAESISNIKFSKNDLNGIGNMVIAVKTLNDTFGQLSENFFKSFLKFSPAKAWALGRRLAKFYKILFSQFDKQNFSDLLKSIGGTKKEFAENAKGFSALADTLMKIDIKHLMKLGLALKNFPSKGGQNLADFFKPIISIINTLPDNVVDKTGTLKDGGKITNIANPKIAAFITVIQTISSITLGQIAKLALMGKVLNEKGGQNIGKFFGGIVEGITKNDKDGKKTQAASKMVKSITIMLMTLTLSLIAITALIAITGITKVVMALGVLTILVAGSYFLMNALSSDKFKTAAPDSLKGTLAITALLLGLTVSLVMVTMIGNKYGFKKVAKGFLALTLLVVAAIGILWLLSSDKFQKMSVDGLIGVGTILLLFVGLSIIMSFVHKFAEHTKDTLIGISVLSIFTLATIGLLWLLSKVANDKTKMLNALLGAAVISLMIVGISGAMLVFGEFLKKLNGVTNETILWGIGLTSGMILGMLGLAHILAPMAGDALFWIGFGMVETVSLMIASISGAMLLFTEFLTTVKDLKKSDIDYAIDRITEKGGMIDCILSIVNALDENIRWKAAPKIAMIGTALRPLMTSLSQFVDVIQKMASLKIADEWDQNGKPTHYLKLEPDAFGQAASNLTTSFSTFLSELSNGLNSFDIASLAIMNLLFPRQSGISKFFTGEKPGIGAVIKTLSSFIDVIQKMASLSVPDKWDKNGQPISYRQLKSSEFGDAAKNLASAFSAFMEGLNTGLSAISLKSAIVLEMLSGPIGEVLTGIGDAFTPIIQIAAGKIAVGNDIVEIDIEKVKSAALGVADVITSLINPLSKLDISDISNGGTAIKSFVRAAENLNPLVNLELVKKEFPEQMENAIKGVKQITDFLQSVKFDRKNARNFRRSLKSFTKGVNYLVGGEKIKNSLILEFLDENFVKQLDTLLEISQKTVDLITNNTFKKDNADNFKYYMQKTAQGINHIQPFLHSTPKQIKDMVKALKMLDVELIEKEEKRTKAIQSVSENFKDMAANIQYLNNTLSESLTLTRSYNQLKENGSQNILQNGANAIVSATEKVKDTVMDAMTTKNNKEKAEQAKKEKDERMTTLGNIIANAVVQAMESWASTKKDITFSFDEQGQKAFATMNYS